MGAGSSFESSYESSHGISDTETQVGTRTSIRYQRVPEATYQVALLVVLYSSPQK